MNALSPGLGSTPETLVARPLRVLVADSHAVNQQLWAHLLKQLGHGSQCAQSGSEVIELAEEFVFDVVLMDLDSAEISGFMTAARLRERAGDLERPWIIGCTLAITTADTDRAMSSGINDLMVRSGRRDELASAMQAARRALSAGRGHGRVRAA